jgi:5-methylcytosine-specific restriction protein A
MKSVEKYANAIDIISSELRSYGLPNENLFLISDISLIETIIKNNLFQRKNKKGHSMYSAALKHLKNYLENCVEFETELIREKLEFEKYILDTPMTNHSINFEDKPKERPHFRSVTNLKVWNRNPKYAIEALAYADYLCEFDKQHKHFISKFTGKNYVEAHHLIPMQYQEKFNFSLDIHANIVCICLTCHKKIHFGLFQVKKEILEKLFYDRINRLTKVGINLTLDQFFSYYQD